MRFCWNCGSQVEDSIKFCDKCGANMAASSQPPTGQPAPMLADTAKQEQPASVAQVSYAREEPRAKPPKASRSGGNTILYAVTAVLVVALIALGVFYGQGVGKLNKANTQITELTANVTSLQGQLATEKANVASLQTQLAAEKANVATLQTQLTTVKSDLTASQAKVTSLTADLATANGKVTSLTADLATANGKVTTTQTSLDKANADLAIANATNTTQAATLRKVQDPRHFDTLAELTAWLAKDDTNTNPAYANLSYASLAYVMQVKALRDGYIIAVQLWWDGTYIYSNNIALVGGKIIYEITPSTDSISTESSFTAALPSRPLPLP